MSGGAVWLAFAVAGIVTFAQRSLFFWLTDSAADRLLPPPVQRALRYVAPAAFAAIAAPRIVGRSNGSRPGASMAPGALNELAHTVVEARFLAALVASVVMWRTGKLPMMLVVGLMALWVFRAAGL